jgi:ABC-type multidrug transport system ATPase subunit
MHDVVLDVANVVKEYNSRTRIGEISFCMQEGQCIGLCGGNGAGKTTIIKMVTGQMWPTSGSIHLKGQRVAPDLENYKQFFSYVPETITMPSHLTGREVLIFFAALRGVSEDRAKEVCEQVGLLKYANKRVGTYSKGMMQRLIIAQALLSVKPTLLVLDEPSDGLDAYWSIWLKQTIKNLLAEGSAILLTSHILSDIEELANKVAIIHSGRMLEFDSINNLYSKYGDAKNFEQLFLGLMKTGNLADTE